jgi:hypothetical protein
MRQSKPTILDGPWMRNIPKRSMRLIIFAVLGTALIGGLFVASRLSSKQPDGNPYDNMHGWQSISGRWAEHAGVFSNPNYGRGDMLIAQRSQGANYRISADIRFDLLFPDTHYGDAGLVIRTTDPEQGVDSYQGYYAGIRPDEQTVVLGRASYDWRQLKAARLVAPVSVGSWYRLEISAHGCALTVTVIPVGGGPTTQIDYQDSNCLTEGAAGLRSFYAQASWRNVKIEQN